ncbi:hypothetical protein CSX04_05872 [Burkholderia cepacia]|nr:hypothetical protein CSX04_05872 [Burkholderia cepacia]
MRRRAVRALEQPRQPEPVDPGEIDECIEADIVAHARMQQIARAGNRGRDGMAAALKRGAQFAAEPRQQAVERLVACELALVAVERDERLPDRVDEAAIVDQRVAERGFDAAEARQVQPACRSLDPCLREVQHSVREAARFGRVAIVQRARLDQDRAARHARMHRPVALELLHALFGEADQHVVVIVRIVCMTAEMRMQALDAGVRIAPSDEPVVARVAAVRRRVPLHRSFRAAS